MNPALRLFERVLQAADGVLNLARDLVSLTFGFQFGVADGLADSLFDLAFHDFGRACDAVFVHGILGCGARRGEAG